MNDAKDIVIEGPPRTANTFMIESFKYVQEREVNIAHHMHAPGQLIRAVRLRKPAILLVRNPTDTCISHAIAGYNKDMSSLIKALDYYIDFYTPLLKYKYYFVVADFPIVVTDPGIIISAVNNKFGTKFNNYNTAYPFNPRVIWDLIDHMYEKWGDEKNLKWFGKNEIDEYKVSRPSQERSALKKELKNTLQHPSIVKKLAKASEIYEQIKS